MILSYLYNNFKSIKIRKYLSLFIFQFVVFICLTVESTQAILYATTARTIQGHEPRLNPTLEAEISQSLDGFSRFSFEFNGIDYNNTNIDTFNIEPMLYTPASLKAAITAKLKTTLSENDATDEDGDDGFKLSVIDSLMIKIKDSSDRNISSRTDNFCHVYTTNTAPFKIEISGDIRLSTKYGDPSYKDYTASTIEINKMQPLKQYTISVAGVCHALPSHNENNEGHPTWESTKGFKFQSDTDASQNFPTTGFNGAKFQLSVVGMNVEELDFETFVNGNVTTSVSSINSKTLLVELSGPSSGQSNGLGPVRFEPPGPIIIRDNNNKFKYMFNIKQWFIPRQGTIRFDTIDGAEYYCDNLTGNRGDYRVPTRADYTNSLTADPILFPPYPQTDGTNEVIGYFYKRAIGGGIFSEWGYTSGGSGFAYPKSDWQRTPSYWTSEAWSSTQQYTVSMGSGYVRYHEFSYKSDSRIACVNQ